jgi:hypothetical protein
MNSIIGNVLSTNEIDNILQSLELTVQCDKGYSQIRSVKYPFLHSSAFKENQKYVDMLNTKYNKDTPYYINEFIEGEI